MDFVKRLDSDMITSMKEGKKLRNFVQPISCSQ